MVYNAVNFNDDGEKVANAGVLSHLLSIPTSSTEIAQGLLNIENKERSNLFAWKGQFSPQLVDVLLAKYAPKNATVLDPFAGSGTVLHECGRRQCSGIAAEINPAAYYMSRTYTLLNFSPSERESYIRDVEQALAPLFRSSPQDSKIHRRQNRPLQQGLISFRRLLPTGLHTALADTLIVLADLYRLDSPQKVGSAWKKLRSIVQTLPYSAKPIRVFNCDARQLPLEDRSVDLVITSPPYINVFNYHQQYRASAEALGWNLLHVARSEIGANRKHRVNRFLTVIQYCLDITIVLSELSRVCKPSARIIFVVGRESKVRGLRFFNGEIVGRLAAGCTCLRANFRQERAFTNRFGELIVEDILHLSPRKTAKHSDLFNFVDARNIARDALLQAGRGIQKQEVEADLRDALEQIETVRPSPIFRADQAQRLT